MAIESFSFDKGINVKKSPLFLEPGEVVSCSGFSFSYDGVLTTREAKTVGAAIDATVTSRINGIHRFGDDLYASSKAYCPGQQSFFNYIYQREITGPTFSNINLLTNNTRPRFADYEKFIFAVDGESKKAYIGGYGYDWGIPAPTVSPIVADGALGSLTGTYDCYFTFYIQFPNGKAMETGPSPSMEVTTHANGINWSRIQVCPYEGSELQISRRLYRSISGIVYLLAIIDDNITTTYTDSVSDVALQLASVLETESYTTPPDNAVDIVVYLQRVFLIVDNKIYWSEPYKPWSFDTTADITVTKEDENLIAGVDWGDQLFLASAERWYRLQGTDPDTWQIKRTFADNGIINRHTIERTKWGILGLWYNGIYNFDGIVSKNLTEKKLGRKFFTDLADLDVCYSEFDGTRYYFYYASTGSTVDSCFIIDFSYAPDYRIYHDDFVAHAHQFHKESGINYWAKSGYEYSDGGTETIPTSLVTGDRPFGAINKRKCLEYLYYDIDTNGQDVTVNIKLDGATADSLTLNTSSRSRARSRKLKIEEGYRGALEITCANSQYLDIYSPWILEATPVGE